MKRRSIFIFALWLTVLAAGIYACDNNSSHPGTSVTFPTTGGASIPTATATATNTFICPFTVTPTITIVPSTNSVQVMVSYTGAGTVSASNVMMAYLTNAVGSGAITQLVQTSPSNNYTFTFTNLLAGNYYFAEIGRAHV